MVTKITEVTRVTKVNDITAVTMARQDRKQLNDHTVLCKVSHQQQVTYKWLAMTLSVLFNEAAK